ncbi:MAG TPA: hypothetical protein VGH70_04335 [Bradyrhizobium sp.]
MKGTDPCLIILTCTAKSDGLATVSGRVGAVIMDRGMIYAKGGALAAQLERWSAWPGLAVAIPTLASRWANSFADVGIGGPLANIDLQWSFGFDVRFGSARLGM